MKKGLNIAGLSFLTLGFAMVILGAIIAAYSGNSTISGIGEFSSLYSTGVVLLGIILTVVSFFIKKPALK